MTDMGVYRITHLASGRSYIGSSIHCARRWESHQVRLNLGIHNNPKLRAAWAKYGADAFCFAVIETVADRSQLIVREQWYLDTERPWYNIAPMASNPMLGRKHTAAHAAAIKAAWLARGGYAKTPEQRAKIAATLRGRPGQPKDEATRQRIAEKLRGHPVSELTRAKISAKGKGYRHTDEAKRRISAAAKVNVTRLMRQKSRFSLADILRIRELRASGMKCRELASLYGVAPQTISKIATGARWSDITQVVSS